MHTELNKQNDGYGYGQIEKKLTTLTKLTYDPKQHKLYNSQFAQMYLESKDEMQTFASSYAKTAQEEQSEFGIPASIKLAQAINESKYGTSRLAQHAHNSFGLKCKKEGTHPHKEEKSVCCIQKNDDTHEDYFMKFTSPWRSFREHSRRLKEGEDNNGNLKYPHLFSQTQTLENWCKGLTQGTYKYSTSSDYPQKLWTLITVLELNKYDNPPIPRT